MNFEKSFEFQPLSLESRGVCSSCSYNSGGKYSIVIEPNQLKENAYASRYNSMRNLDNQGKGCPS